MPEDGTGQYLYGVVRGGTSVDGSPAGVQGQPVALVTDGDLAAVVSDVPEGITPGRRHDLTAHHEVLRRLALRVDVAPMQFGLVLASAQAVRTQVLQVRHDLLQDILHRVAGTVQVSLRATFDEATLLGEVVRENAQVRLLRERTKDRPGGGLDPELLRLGELVAHEVERKRQAEADRLLQRVVTLAERYRRRDGGDPQQVLDVALLVRRRQLATVEAALEQLAEEVHPRLWLRLTPPTAAFDFVEEPTWV